MVKSFSDSDSEGEIAQVKKVAETGSDCDSDSSSKEQSRHGKRERSEDDSSSKRQRTDSNEEGVTVFVGGLSFDADEAAVTDFFSSCGSINSLRLPVFEDSGKRRGIAFIEFADAAAANKACELDGQEMMGRWLKVNISTGKPAAGTERNGRPAGLSQRPDNCTAIFVGNLSWNASEDDLRRIFGECGSITGCRIAVDQDSGRSKGFGHVEFDSADAVDAAVKLSNIEIDGRTIRIDYSGPRTGGERRGGGRGGSFGGGRGRGRGGFDRGGRGGGRGRGGRGGFNSGSRGGYGGSQGKRVAFD